MNPKWALWCWNHAGIQHNHLIDESGVVVARFERKEDAEFVAEIIKGVNLKFSEALAEDRPKTAKRFYDEVCEIAEETMQKTGRVEGAHYNAMKTVLRSWGIEE